MASHGVFEKDSLSALEIGAGTGSYLEKVLSIATPAKYEVYEPAKDWSDYLRSTYPIIAYDTDGTSLKYTKPSSVDFLHAHGVFVYLPFLVSYNYFIEIWRVTKPGAIVIFDIISENCLDEDTVLDWLSSENRYPCFLSKELCNFYFREKKI